jgi:hypothetical protein
VNTGKCHAFSSFYFELHKGSERMEYPADLKNEAPWIYSDITVGMKSEICCISLRLMAFTDRNR